MSKYIKLEDAIEALQGREAIISSAYDAVAAIKAVPTIKTSEDCISREYILGEAFASDEYNRETKSFDLPVVSVRDIEDAPSVVPQVPSEDCISREFVIEVISDYVNYPTEGDKTCAIKDAPSVVSDFKTFCGVPIEEAIDVLEKYKSLKERIE